MTKLPDFPFEQDKVEVGIPIKYVPELRPIQLKLLQEQFDFHQQEPTNGGTAILGQGLVTNSNAIDIFTVPEKKILFITGAHCSSSMIATVAGVAEMQLNVQFASGGKSVIIIQANSTAASITSACNQSVALSYPKPFVVLAGDTVSSNALFGRTSGTWNIGKTARWIGYLENLKT